MTPRSPLKVVVVCYSSYGGSGIVATEMGLALAKRGHKIYFVSTAIPKRLELDEQENVWMFVAEAMDYPLFPAKSLIPSAMTSKLSEIIRQEKPDIINVHYAIPYATSALIARECARTIANVKKLPKVVVTLHGTDVTVVGSTRCYQEETLYSVLGSDGVTVPSSFLKNAAHDKLRIPSEKAIEVIPNFVNSAQFKPLSNAKEVAAVRSELGVRGNKPILSHVSNFRPIKKIDDVVKTFAAVNQKRASHLVLIGDGPERPNIEALVKSLNLTERVSFLGRQRHFGEVLAATDVFLLPSESESFGLAALEAMSCGVPVVASQAGGLSEVVIHGETGYLAEVGDVERMAEYCLRILRNKETKKGFSEKARTRAETVFSEEQIVSQYERFFYSTLEN